MWVKYTVSESCRGQSFTQSWKRSSKSNEIINDPWYSVKFRSRNERVQKDKWDLLTRTADNFSEYTDCYDRTYSLDRIKLTLFIFSPENTWTPMQRNQTVLAWIEDFLVCIQLGTKGILNKQISTQFSYCPRILQHPRWQHKLRDKFIRLLIWFKCFWEKLREFQL